MYVLFVTRLQRLNHATFIRNSEIMYSNSDSSLQDAGASAIGEAAYSGSQNSDREPIQVMVVGSHRGIESIIKGLHSLGFAEAGDWSKPQRYPNSDRSMSITTKWRSL